MNRGLTLEQRLALLESVADDLMAGLIAVPTGQASIRGKQIKPSSITAGLISVDSLEAVQSKTGSLSVTGNVTVGNQGAIYTSGKPAYGNANAGIWLGYDAGAYKMDIGSSSQYLRWNGTALSMSGSITATTGSIGGWTIGATDLQGDSGTMGLATSGSVRIWSGNATPSSAPFQVSSTGAITSTAGTIGGLTIDGTSGLILGTGASTRGISTGATAFYAGSATPASAPFRVGTDGAVVCSNLTISTVTGTLASTNIPNLDAGKITTGTINASTINVTNLNASNLASGSVGSGAAGVGLGGTNGLTVNGTLTIGSGGKIIDADGSYWDQNGIVLVSAGTYGDSIRWRVAGTDAGSLYCDSTAMTVRSGSAVTGKDLTISGNKISIVGAGTNLYVGYNSGKVQTTQNFYPGNTTTGAQATYYIDAGGIISNGIGIGGMLGISSGNTINLVSPGSGGSAGNWSSWGGATGAGYFVAQLGGTNIRVPYCLDA